jgi:hypothetical protein
MKKILSLLPQLGLALGLVLLFSPDLSPNHQAHNHSFYLFSIILPFTIVVVTFLRFTNIIRSIHRFQFITILILTFFAFFHLLPQSTSFKYHHQSSSVTEHPCCMPQLADSVEIAEATIKVSFISQTIEMIPKLQLEIFTKSVNNRSPPFLFS